MDGLERLKALGTALDLIVEDKGDDLPPDILLSYKIISAEVWKSYYSYLETKEALEVVSNSMHNLEKRMNQLQREIEYKEGGNT